MIVISFVVSIFLIMLLWSIRADWKSLRESSDRLHQRWGEYYAETRKYRKMESVYISYKDGSTCVMEASNLVQNESTISLYDEHSKVNIVININEIKSIKVNRSDEFIEGRRNLHDEY